MRAWRARVLFGETGDKRALMIRRLRCADCGHIHHELPDCIVPYKRHCAETIETIVAGSPQKALCDERTTRRILAWWSVASPYFLNILQSLAEKFRMTFRDPPAFREIIRAAANSNNWTFANLICTCSVVLTG